MDFEQLAKIEDEAAQVAALYEMFDENARLNRSKAARVEFLTTVHYIEKYLTPEARILDIGAGAGEYSLYFARKGYRVDAVELAERNLEAFRQKLAPDDPVTLRQGNAVDLSDYEANSFDIVLLFGPLYHLHQEADRQKCIAEAKRVCKPDGTIFFAFIANDMVVLTELAYNPQFFLTDEYDHESFKVVDFPFVVFTVSACRCMLKDGGIHIAREIAADGVSELMAKQINEMDEESYRQYLRYHFYICEKPEMLGHSNHLLFVGKKASL